MSQKEDAKRIYELRIIKMIETICYQKVFIATVIIDNFFHLKMSKDLRSQVLRPYTDSVKIIYYN